MRHSDEQLAAAEDLLADGLSRAEADKLNLRFTASLRPIRQQPAAAGSRKAADAAILSTLTRGQR